MDDTKPLTALVDAVRIAGGQSSMARHLSHDKRQLRQGHVWAWVNRERKAPAEFCLAIERLTGVSRHDLRPDVFGEAPETGREERDEAA